jgi:hypothetical protein
MKFGFYSNIEPAFRQNITADSMHQLVYPAKSALQSLYMRQDNADAALQRFC